MVVMMMIMERKGRERHKTQEKQVMHSIVAHQPLMDGQHIPDQRSTDPGHLPSVCVRSLTFRSMEYLFSLLRSAVPGHAPSQFLVHLFTGRAWEIEKFLI